MIGAMDLALKLIVEHPNACYRELTEKLQQMGILASAGVLELLLYHRPQCGHVCSTQCPVSGRPEER
jgi:hypothetical protein